MPEDVNVSDVPVLSEYRGEFLRSKEELERFALQLRLDMVEITYHSGTGSSHLGGELSCAEILAVLYGGVLNLRPEEPEWPGRDVFIMSKGHCSAIMYAAMAWRGFFGRDRLWNEFNRVGGRLEEHCNLQLPGVEAVTGSLGMGLSNACGYAWAAKYDRQDERRVYCLLGDGECTEGQAWEGMGLAAQLRLDNLVAILDYNKYAISAPVAEGMNLEPLESRCRDFGWWTERVDGHDATAVLAAMERAKLPATAPEKPRMLICDTVKGKGIGFMERDAVNWHAGHLDADSRQRCLEELGCPGGRDNG